jgi:hypothetical protein
MTEESSFLTAMCDAHPMATTRSGEYKIRVKHNYRDTGGTRLLEMLAEGDTLEA